MPRTKPLLAVEGLSVAFDTGGRRKPVLREISFTLAHGEVLGIVGESGSGKTTLLFAIANYLPPGAVVEAGDIRFDGLDLMHIPAEAGRRLRGRRIAMVYQDPAQALNPAMRIGTQIAEVRRYHFSEPESSALRHACELLTAVGIDTPERIADSYPHQLSGGQQQRAMIAMALAGEPDLLLMDEPTTALDVIVQAQLLDLIRDLKRRTKVALLFVSHDLGAVAAIADRIGVLYAGDLMELGPANEVLRQPANPYTRVLLSAIPRVDARQRVKGIAGSLPRDRAAGSGCIFADRCDVAEARCRKARPRLQQMGAEDWLSRCHFLSAPAALHIPPVPAGAPPAVAKSQREDDSPLLAVTELSIDYRQPGAWGWLSPHVVHAVQNVSFTIRHKQVLSIVGESGSGKTSIARTLLRLQGKRSGSVVFEGEDVFALGADDLRFFRRRVQMVFQNPTSSLNPRKTVGELVARPLRLAGASINEASAGAAAMLTAVGLNSGLLARFPHQLSGGEKQRVAIARAFVTGPKLVILDEPTTSLDTSVQASILELLEQLKVDRGCSYLLITHDLAVVRNVADSVVVMKAGEICESGAVESVFGDPRHPYTKSLCAAALRI